jgi:hypothetical protein
MLAHLRCFVPALVTITGVALSPAYSNPIADRADPKVATGQAAAPAATQETCLSRPGNTSMAGQRWVYHREGQRKCWFQTTEQPRIKKTVRSANVSVVTSAENESIRPKPKRIEDAQAKLLPLGQESAQAPLPAPGREVVAAAPVLSAEPASRQELDREVPDKPAERQLDANIFLTGALSQKVGSQASVVAPAPPVHSTLDALDNKPRWPPTWIAVLLMTLGFGAIRTALFAIS